MRADLAWLGLTWDEGACDAQVVVVVVWGGGGGGWVTVLSWPGL